MNIQSILDCGNSIKNHLSNTPIDQCISSETIALLSENKENIAYIACATGVVLLATYLFATRNSSNVSIDLSKDLKCVKIRVPVYKGISKLSEADKGTIKAFQDRFGFISENGLTISNLMDLRGYAQFITRVVTHGAPWLKVRNYCTIEISKKEKAPLTLEDRGIIGAYLRSYLNN